MSIYDGLPDPTRPALALMDGFARGRAEGEERAVRGALSAYAMNPDDPAAFEQIARYRPEFAMQIRQDRSKQEQAAQEAELRRRAAGGDKEALAQLWGIDHQAANTIGDDVRQEAAARADVIGQAALRISQLEPAQRPAAWDAAVRQLSEQYPELAEYEGQYSEEAMMGAIDAAEQVHTYFDLERPHWMTIPEGGTMVNVDDPAAVTSFVSGQGATIPTVASPEEAKNLPPGTEFRTPDGRTLRVPGGPASAPGTFRP